MINFSAFGAINEVAWPGTEASGFGPWSREDELWKHSCFEVFGKVAGESGYLEVNFATSGKWAAYTFADYRAVMRPADNVAVPAANWLLRPYRADMNAMIEVPHAYAETDWIVGFSAVIEAKDGTKSFWALAHGPGTPDFHHHACFMLELPAPGGA